MKKINELVTSAEKPENRAKKKAITFGSFKRAEEKQIQERKDREHQAELARIAEQARLTREIADEEERVIREESKRKRNEFITGSLKNAFGTKTNVDMNPVREEVIDKYIPQLKEPKKEERPTPFKAEPALNAELEEFKKKINEHLHKVGFASSSGGGAGSFADLDDVDPTTAKVNGKTIQFDSSTNKFVGADVTAGALAADNLTAGDAAINLTTTSGNITIDATANNSDIIFKGTDATSDITMLTLDGSEAGAAIFNAGLVIADAGNIGSASDTDAIAIASTGVVTMNQIPVFSAGINVSGGSIAGTLATVAQTNITSLGTLTALQVDNLNINGNTLSSTAGTDLLITPLNGQQIVLDGTIVVDAGVVTGATSITSTAFVGGLTGNVTGNASGTAATVTTAAQTNITSLGTLTALTVDNIVINGANIGHTSDTDAIAIDSSGNVTASQNLIVTGDFTVNGTTTTVSTTNMKVSDTLIELNTGATSNANDMGIIMERGSTGNNAIFMFDESADEFTVGLTTATNDATGNISVTAGTFTAATLKGNLVVADDGDIGSASATDAMQISSAGIVTFKDDILLKDACTIGTATTAGAISIAADGTVNLATAGATVNSVAIKTVGKETIYIPASAMYPTTTNGCEALAQVETTAQQPEFKVLDFDKDSDEHAQFTVAFPKSWNAGTITFRAFWIGIAATTGCAWALQGKSVADNTESVAAFGTAIVVQDDSQGDATETLVSAESGAVTIAGAADNTLTYFQIFRDVSDGNDDMAGDARLLGVQLFFTTDAANDA
jgi:hypothetical protein